MIPMLIIGHVFAIRSDWPLCREVQVNFAYRWFGGLSIEDKVPDHSAFSHACNERFGDCANSGACSNAWWGGSRARPSQLRQVRPQRGGDYQCSEASSGVPARRSPRS